MSDIEPVPQPFKERIRPLVSDFQEWNHIAGGGRDQAAIEQAAKARTSLVSAVTDEVLGVRADEARKGLLKEFADALLTSEDGRSILISAGDEADLKEEILQVALRKNEEKNQ